MARSLDLSMYKTIVLFQKGNTIPNGWMNAIWKADLVLEHLGENKYYVRKNRHGNFGEVEISDEDMFIARI